MYCLHDIINLSINQRYFFDLFYNLFVQLSQISVELLQLKWLQFFRRIVYMFKSNRLIFCLGTEPCWVLIIRKIWNIIYWWIRDCVVYMYACNSICSDLASGNLEIYWHKWWGYVYIFKYVMIRTQYIIQHFSEITCSRIFRNMFLIYFSVLQLKLKIRISTYFNFVLVQHAYTCWI